MDTLRRHLANLGFDPHIDLLSLVSLFGIWTQHTWVLWVNTSDPALPAWLPWQGLYAVLAAVMLGVAAWTLWRQGHPRPDDATGRAANDPTAQPTGARPLPRLDLALATVGAACTLGMGLSRQLGAGPAWTALALVAGTACYAWAYIRWGEFYQRLSLKQAILLLFGGAMVADVAKTLLSACAPIAATVLATCLPPLSTLMCLQAQRSLDVQEASTAERPGTPVRYTRSNIGALWRVAAVFVAFSLVNSMMLALFHPSASTGLSATLPGRLFDLALCAALLAYVFRLHGTFDFSQLWSAVLILLATDLLAYVLAPDTDLPRFFATASLNFIVLFIWLALADIAHHSDIHPHAVFGVGWSLYALPLFLGTFTSEALAGGGGGAAYAAVLLYMICLATTLFLDARNQDTKYVFCDLRPEQATTPRDFADIDSRCALVAQRHALTARELEIMQMLCKGRSKAYIAETLFITENTVKSHTKRMYAKLDVHNRRELQELIEA